MKIMKPVYLAFLLACHNQPDAQVVKPNPTAADCLVERDERQAECFHLYKVEVERSVCLDRVREGIDCSTPAGVQAWLNGKKDGGN
jgi:hypothetical protein